MEEKKIEIYDAFEQKLLTELCKLCRERGKMGDRLLNSDDIDAKWDEFGRDCMIDSVHEFNQYPEVTLAWAAYLGMGIAKHWDENWRKNHKNTYNSYYGVRGYDDMDEHIVRDILGYGLDSPKAKEIEGLLSECAIMVLNLIRHEGFESQSVEAYYILIRSVKTMFRIGQSIELFSLGYRLESIKK